MYDLPGNATVDHPLPTSGDAVVVRLGFDKATGNKNLNVLVVMLQAVCIGIFGAMIMGVLVSRQLSQRYHGTRMIGKAYMSHKREEHSEQRFQPIGEDRASRVVVV